jgi:hypothetical protein
MNAHQKYAHNLVTGLKPADVAAMVALPPSAKSTKEHRVEDIHQAVLDYGEDGTKAAWADLLADAAGVKREDGWPANWAVGIMALITDIDQADDGADDGADARELRAA